MKNKERGTESYSSMQKSWILLGGGGLVKKTKQNVNEINNSLKTFISCVKIKHDQYITEKMKYKYILIHYSVKNITFCIVSSILLS